jgi:hypothetical protein
MTSTTHTYKTNGLEGTVTSIARDQFANEGFGLETFSNKIDGFTGTPGEGAGNPYYLNAGTDRVSTDFIYQGAAGDFVESSVANDLIISLNAATCDALQLGDIIVVEFVGQMSCIQYGSTDFTAAGFASTSLETPSINAGTDKHADYYAELIWYEDVNGGGFSQVLGSRSCSFKVSPWCRWGTTTTAQNVSYSSGETAYTGPLNAGIGAYQTFHIAMHYIVLGTETSLEFKVLAVPAAGSGSQAGLVANPAIRVKQGSTVFAHVLRRSVA